MGLIIQQGAELPSVPLAAVLPAALVALGLGYFVWTAVYNLYFHPLRSFPGPKLWAAFHLPYACSYVSGDMHNKMLALHNKYGPVVRTAPNFLDFSSPEAERQIRGHRRAGKPEHEKDPNFWAAFRGTVLGAPREHHGRYRRALSHGFSAQAMLDQQPLIQSYVDILMQRLAEVGRGGTAPVDMVKWFNYTTFDIIGDLSFGEPFRCLEASDYHPWVALIFDTIRWLVWMRMLGCYPFTPLLARLFVRKEWIARRAEHEELSAEKVRKRLALPTQRPDFIDAMTVKRESAKGEQLTFEELVSHASVLIIAGSETTATALSGSAYFLGTHPPVLAKLTREVRDAFASESEIDLVSVQRLPYLSAVVEETLRLFPPAPGGHPRVIAEGGDTILGQYLPAGTRVEVWVWSLHRSAELWSRPEEFIPERWLGDARFADDKRDALLPFSYGPRNCIGKNLAYAEMRLILAKLVWNYDLTLAEDSRGWIERCKLYALWDKPPVNMYLKPRAAGTTDKEASASELPAGA